VHRHVTNILRKLGLPSRAAAAAYAVRTGLAEARRA
jgi:DNA-binding NarL/FixJ family response regulator